MSVRVIIKKRTLGMDAVYSSSISALHLCGLGEIFLYRPVGALNQELYVGRQLSRGLGRPFERAYQSLLKKAKKDTGIRTLEGLSRIEEPRFLVDVEPIEDFEQIEKQYNAVMEAIDRKVKIKITYKAMGSQEETRRSIAPYGLIAEYGLWYVIGYCNLRKDIRVFALDCIKYFKITGKPYTIPPDFNINEYFKPAWHMLRYGKPVEVVLKFTEHYARWIKRRKWHPTQVIEEKPDGSIIFRVTVEGTRELKWWIYHWIPYCEILEPPELRREIIEEMRGMLEVYGRG